MSNELDRCRVCLGNSNDYTKCLSLFESYEESTVCAHISCLARVQIREGDGLPDRICPECLLQLGAALAFRRKCEASDKLLRGAALSQVPVEFKHEHDADDAPVKEEAEASDECDAEAECAAPSAARPSRSVDLQLVCDDCQGRFKSKCKLRVHWKKAHLADKLTCPDCKRMFHSYKAFNNHVKNKSRSCKIAAELNIQGQGKTRIFQCKHCPYNRKSIELMKVHMIVHTGEKRFHCNKCDKKYSQISALNSHKERVHNEIKNKNTCDICGLCISGRDKFYNHRLTHKTPNYTCDVCNKVMKYRYSLVNHIKRHSGVKDVTCDLCEAAFYTTIELRNHKNRTHLKKKKHKYKCDLCDYNTWRKYAYVKHKSKHIGTNLPCLQCGSFFDDALKLEHHMRLHAENKYECVYCGNRYATSKCRSKHVRTKHKDVHTKHKYVHTKHKNVHTKHNHKSETVI